MQYLPVDSSNIAAICYAPDLRDLFVKFHTGAVYVHHDVPQDGYDALMAAESVGRHYAKHFYGNGESIPQDLSPSP